MDGRVSHRVGLFFSSQLDPEGLAAWQRRVNKCSSLGVRRAETDNSA